MIGKNELSFFEMFVSEDVINLIVTQTNIYAEQQIISGMANETITKESRLNSWKETDYNEIRTFIAFLIWMGLDSKPSLPDYWRRTPLYKSDISKYMPRNRFELLLRMFHLANNDECPENDRLHKVQSLVHKMNENVVVMKWQDKRDVLFLSTKHKDDMIEVTHREGPKRKPAAIIEYNNAKSFVDMSDQRTAYSSSLRKSVKWYRKVAFELITGTSVVNALIIFNKINQTKISVTKFKETVCMQLLQSSNPPLPIQVQQKHELTQNALNKRGRCTICYKRNSELHGRDYAVKNTKRIIYVCNGCEGNPFICLDCFFVNHVFMKRN
nr:unnamed protein product [Callosobruchus chinensis]